MLCKKYVSKGLGSLALGWALFSFLTTPAMAQCGAHCSRNAEAGNMDLVGYDDLQGRSAYYPVIVKQGDRYIAYVGLHGEPPRLNPLTGKIEGNGTFVVDVTDPRHPKDLAHIPGEVLDRVDGETNARPGGAQFTRVCSGSELPRADKGKFYMLRNFGLSTWEMWDVTDPANPSRLNVIVSGTRFPHKMWWECDSGIAYLPSGPFDWLTPPAAFQYDAIIHALVYDLSDPVKPVFIRSFGLPGQQPGSAVQEPLSGLHGVVSTGPKGNRVYFSFGSKGDGILEIVDREKLLNGPKEPTDDNLRYPVVGRIDLPHYAGAQMAFPLLQMRLTEFAKQKNGSVQDFLTETGQENVLGCSGYRQILRMFDITDEKHPVGVSTWTVPEASGDFCGSRGGRFGAHMTDESFGPIYYKRVLFLTFFNAGVRALDIRDPYHPKEIGYYIPAVTDNTNNTQKLCRGEGAEQDCKIAIETDGVEVDDRGFIYIVDQVGTGMHILELTGPARQVAGFSR